MRKPAFLALAVLGVLAHFTVATAAQMPDVSSGTVVPGIWNSNYRAVRLYSDQYRVPMFVFYGSTDCGASSSFIDTLNKGGFAEWLKVHPIVLAFKYGTTEQLAAARSGTDETSKEPDFRAARNWLKSVNKSMTEYPFVGIYWRKPDGTVVQRAFPGRSDRIPTVAGSGAKTAEEKLLAVLEKDLGSYVGGETPVTPTTGIVDIHEVSVLEAQQRNSHLYAARSFSFPVLAEMSHGRVVTGTLEVKQTSVGALVAEYSALQTKKLKFKGSWDELNLDTGDALTVLSEKDCTLTLALAKNGVLTASAEMTSEYSLAGGVPEVGCGMMSVASSAYAPFYGLYTVALPMDGGDVGSGWLTLKASRAGRVSWTAYMPDGMKFSGSASLALQTDGTASLTVFKVVKNKGALTADLAVKPYAESDWTAGKSGCAVWLPGSSRLWYRNLPRNTENFADAQGGFFLKGSSPRKLCGLFGYEETFDLKLDGATVVQFGTQASGFAFRKNDVVNSFSYSSGNGTFSGSATVLMSGRKVRGTISGVVTPGVDATSPVFGSGTFHATGVSLPVSLEAARK